MPGSIGPQQHYGAKRAGDLVEVITEVRRITAEQERHTLNSRYSTWPTKIDR